MVLVFLKAICFLQRRAEAEAAIARGDVVLNDASLEDPIAITRQGNLQLYSDVSGSSCAWVIVPLAVPFYSCFFSLCLISSRAFVFLPTVYVYKLLLCLGLRIPRARHALCDSSW